MPKMPQIGPPKNLNFLKKNILSAILTKPYKVVIPVKTGVEEILGL
jgi:hypothetical protein